MASGKLCVFCRAKPVDPAWRPFCSERCKFLDLARWLDGQYKVPGEPVPASEDEEQQEKERRSS